MSDNLIEVAEAFEVIRKAMQEDNPSEAGSYAHSWHCNISCMCMDVIEEKTMLGHADAIEIGNEAATRFMKLCFNVNTKA